MAEIGVFVGTYERFIFRYTCNRNTALKFERTASHAAHIGSVRCIETLGSSVFSGGQDDSIQVYNTQDGRNVGFLQVPNVSSVRCLSLFGALDSVESSLLLDGCSDGSVHFWTPQDEEWTLEKTKTFHKASLNSMDIHSSGKMAFSLAKDRSLVLWDLNKMKRAFSCKLAVDGERIKFHPYSPNNYLLSYHNTVSRMNLGDEKSIEVWTQMADVQDFAFWKEDLFWTVADDGGLRLWDERQSQPQTEIQDGHSSRIKGLTIPQPDCLITGSSDGVLKYWDPRKLTGKEGNCAVIEEKTEARITCLTSTIHQQRSSKRKRNR